MQWKRNTHRADNVDIAANGRDFVLHYTNFLEKLLHVLALPAAAALEIRVSDSFADAKLAQTVHHCKAAAGCVFTQQMFVKARNFKDARAKATAAGRWRGGRPLL